MGLFEERVNLKPYEIKSKTRVYRIYPNGLIKSISKNKEKYIGKTTTKGYRQVSINILGLGEKHYYVHRLIAKYFIPNPENKPFVNHKDGNKQNNSVDNLEWCTQYENNRHAYLTGLWKHKGINHSLSKLTKKDVYDIRSIYSKGGTTQKELGKIYNVSQSCIYKIVNNLRWVK